MKISKNFILQEFLVTNTGLNNQLTSEALANIEYLATKLLQPLRDAYGKPIRITSGYRSAEVNKAVGGSPTSQHTKGQAVDIVAEDNKALFDLIKSSFDFDQLIWEYGTDKQPDWVHVSLKKTGNRKQIMRAIKNKSGKTLYVVEKCKTNITE